LTSQIGRLDQFTFLYSILIGQINIAHLISKYTYTQNPKYLFRLNKVRYYLTYLTFNIPTSSNNLILLYTHYTQILTRK